VSFAIVLHVPATRRLSSKFDVIDVHFVPVVLQQSDTEATLKPG